MRSGESKGNAGKATKRKRQMLQVPRTKAGSGKVHREKENEKGRQRKRDANALQHNVGILLRKKMQDLKR